MNSVVASILAYIQNLNLIQKNATVIIGLSGGPDSVFLLHVLAHMRDKGIIKHIVAAHLDHQWRENSGNDVMFCKQLAEQHAIEFVHTTLKELALQNPPSGSKEELGRIARRTFFAHLAKTYQADAIALAHHADDQQETFFLRLLRGTSLSGLIGIRPKQGLYIRPLLKTSKQDILSFLDNHAIPYLIDPSNTSHEFLRNRIRLQAIPALRNADARFDTSFAKTLDSLQETEDFLQTLTSSTFNLLATRTNNVWQLDSAQLLAQHPTMVKRLLVFWFCKEEVAFPVSKGFFEEVIKFIKTGQGSHAIHTSWSIQKTRHSIWIEKKKHSLHQ